MTKTIDRTAVRYVARNEAKTKLATIYTWQYRMKEQWILIFAFQHHGQRALAQNTIELHSILHSKRIMCFPHFQYKSLTCSLLGSVCVLVKVSLPLILISSASAGGNGAGKTTTSLFSVSELKHTSYC